MDTTVKSGSYKKACHIFELCSERNLHLKYVALTELIICVNQSSKFKENKIT